MVFLIAGLGRATADDLFTKNPLTADFNGDGVADALSLPSSSAAFASMVPGGNGRPGWQVPAGYLGLDWVRPNTSVTLADFNGDGRADMLFQPRDAGDAGGLMFADRDGRFGTLDQPIAADHLGFDWTTDATRLVAADLNGDGRSELVLQAQDPLGLFYVVRTDAAGQLAAHGQGWVEGHLSETWSTPSTRLYVGDFNGDHHDDLLLQPQGTLHGQPAAAQHYAMVHTDANGDLTSVAERWALDGRNAEWDPATHELIVGDFDSDGIDDIWLKSRNPKGWDYVLAGRVKGGMADAVRWNDHKSPTEALARARAGAQGTGPKLPGQGTGATGTKDTGAKPARENEKPQDSNAPKTTAVGYTKGEFSVDPTGAGNYRVKIAVPPGTAGMQPDLAFLYSSRAGNGQLGVGWSVSGLSAVSRCPMTKAQDGAFDGVDFDELDQFCLDGQRLIKVAGTHNRGGAEYRTEIASFQKVMALGSSSAPPTGFRVYDKAGLVRDYGATTESTIEVKTRAGATHRLMWPVSKIRDRYGNFIDFKYGKTDVASAPTEYWVDRIEYGNKNLEVLGHVWFEYGDDRPDKTGGFMALGAKSQLTKRLNQLHVYSRNTQVRHYRLEYGQHQGTKLSQLTSIQECDSNSACFAPTLFSWTQGQVGVSAWDPWINTNQLSSFSVDGLDHMTYADLNGNGAIDWIQIRNGQWKVSLDKPTSGGDADLNVGADRYDRRATAVDFDSDGHAELLVPVYKPYPTPVTQAFERVQIGWEFLRWDQATKHLVPSTVGAPMNGGIASYIAGTVDSGGAVIPDAEDEESGVFETTFADLNGDGFSELLFKRWDEVSERYEVAYFRNYGPAGNYFAGTSGVAAPVITDIEIGRDQHMTPGEFDGDGQPEIFISRTKCEVGCSDTVRVVKVASDLSSASELPSIGVTLDSVNLIDINGDGLTDILGRAGNPWRIYRNEGGLFVLGDTASLAPINGLGVSRIFPNDYNHDGRTDLLTQTGNGSPNWQFFLSEGEKFGAAIDSGINAAAADNSTVLDWSGAGGYGIVFVPEYDGSITPYHGHSVWGSVQFMQKATNGIGDTASMYYAPLTGGNENYPSSTYSGPTDDGLPAGWRTSSQRVHADFMGPLYVVAGFYVSNGETGRNSSVSTGYRYEGAKMNLEGRGFVGFSKIIAMNQDAALITENEHRQDFPYTGTVVHATRSTAPEFSITEAVQTEHPPCVNRLGEPGEADGCNYPEQIDTVTLVDAAKKLSETTNVVGLMEWGTPKQYYPYVATSTQVDYDYREHQSAQTNDTVLRVTTTSIDYDYTGSDAVDGSFGNATQVSVNTTNAGGADAHSTVTVNTYAESSGGSQNRSVVKDKWCLGRLERASVTHDAPAGQSGSNPAPVTRTSAFGYDWGAGPVEGLARCALVSETVEPGNALSLTKTYSFEDGFGNRTQEQVSGSGQTRTTRTTYDHYGQFPIATTNSLGHSERRVYDARWGAPTSVTGPNGIVTRFEYDNFGRKTREIAAGTAAAPRGDVHTTYAYQFCNGAPCISNGSKYRIVATSTSGAVSTTEFDMLDREVAKTSYGLNGNLLVQQTRYDRYGRPFLASLPYDASGARICWIMRSYDTINRVIREYAPGEQSECDANSLTNISYDTPPVGYSRITDYVYEGFTTTVTAPERDSVGGTRRATASTKNASGRLALVEDVGQASLTRYDYDSMGNTTWTSTFGSQPITLGFDLRGFKTSMIDPDMGSWGYGYNAFGELMTQTDAENRTTTMAYDALGRMVQRVEKLRTEDPNDTEQDLTTTWTYDNGYGAGVGKLALVQGPDGYLEAYEYDELGRQTDAIRVIDGEMYWTTQTYDAQDRPNVLVYPDVQSFNQGATAPPVPTLSVTTSATTGQPQLSWTGANATALFTLYRHLNAEPEANALKVYVGTRTAFGDGLTTESTYRYFVTACHGTNCATSNPVTVAVNLAPPAPSFLAVPGVDTDGSFALNWGPSDAGVTYRLYEAVGTAAFGASPIWTGTTLTTTLSGRLDGDYRYQIEACEGATLCSARVDGDNAVAVDKAPGAPGALALPEFSYNGYFTVAWGASSTAGLTRSLHYRLETTDTVFGAGVWREVYRGQALSYGVEGAAAGLHWFRVRACNGDGEALCSAWSPAHGNALEDNQVGVGTPPAAPTAMTAPAVSPSGNYTVSWTASVVNISSFQVDESTSPNFASTTRSTIEGTEESCLNGMEMCYVPPVKSLAVTGRSDGLTYYYRVRTCGTFVCSAWFPAVNAVGVNTVAVKFPPAAPGMPSATPNPSGDGAFTLSWSVPTGTVTRYIVRQHAAAVGVAAAFNSATTLTPDSTTNSRAIAGAAMGDHYFWISACNDTSCGAWSAASAAVRVRPGPASITAPGSSSNGAFTVSWPAASDISVEYGLYRSTTADFASPIAVEVAEVCTHWVQTQEGPECWEYDQPASVDLTGVPNGDQWFGVRYCYPDGYCSPFTTTASPTVVAAAPGIPASISVPASSAGSLTVNWGTSTGTVTSYELYESTAAGFSPQTLVYSGTALSAPLSGRAAGTYYYRVRACYNGTACSAYRTGGNSHVVYGTPTAPASITVPTTSNGSLTVNWAATSPVTAYELYESTNAGFSPQTLVYSGAALTVALTGRAAGTYYYQVRACNTAVACSSYRVGSNSHAAYATPTAPASISVPASGTGSLTVSWAATSPVTAYELYESTNAGFSPQTLVYSGTGLSTALSGRAAGTYYYQVRACNTAVACSGYRIGGNSHTVYATPTAPGSISVPTTGNGSLTVSWAATSPVTAYELYESTSPGFSPQTLVYSGTGLSAALSGRGAGTYYYQVRACNTAVACSGYRTGGNSHTVYPIPGVPSSISVPASDNDGNYSISWGSGSGTVTAYELYESTSSGFGTQTLVYSGTGTSAALSGRASGTYYYRVRACNTAVSCSGYRTGGNATTVAIVPSVPASISTDTEYSEGPFTISWGIASGTVTAYELYESSSPSFSTQTLRYSGTLRTKAFNKALTNIFYYRARACNTSGCSGYTATVTVVVEIPEECGPMGCALVEPAKLEELVAEVEGNSAPSVVVVTTPVAPRAKSGKRVKPHRQDPLVLAAYQARMPKAGARAVKVGKGTRFQRAAKPTGTYTHRVQNVYNGFGHLTGVRACIETDTTACTGVFYWQATAADAMGKVTGETLGNGLVTTRTYDAASGYLTTAQTTGGIQNAAFNWDAVGNLEARSDSFTQGGSNYALSESFTHDALDRIKTSSVAGLTNANRWYDYDSTGNITQQKRGGISVLDYVYGGFAGPSPRPHAVRQVIAQAGTRSYTYDKNGNLTQVSGGGADRRVCWSSSNLPTFIATGTGTGCNVGTGFAYSSFTYAPGRERVKQVASDGTITTTTTYVGGLFEKETKNGQTTYRHYISAGGAVVAVYKRGADCGAAISCTEYWHKDHLGSVVAISDGNGQPLSRMSYDVWGKRRDALTWADPTIGTNLTATEKRGYTGHEMLDAIGLVHMNGRVYDPEIGRFLSADTFVQFPDSSQGFNRYTYVNNNPLSFTDPTGHLSFGEIFGIFLFIASAGSCTACLVVFSAMYGYAMTGSIGLALQSGLMAFAGGYVTGMVNGLYVPGTLGFVATLLARGVAQGAMSAAGGGRFGDGFLSALASVAGGIFLGKSPLAQIVVAGTVSELGGGTFANGALSVVFAYALGPSGRSHPENDAAQSGGANSELTDEQVEAQAKDVRGSFKAGSALAGKYISAYCQTNPDACAGLNPEQYEKVPFEFQKRLFAPGQSKTSETLTGADVVRDKDGVVLKVRLYAGGIALQGKGVGPLAVAEVLIHEFWHTTPVGTALNMGYNSAVDAGRHVALPYLNRPMEVGARAFATAVMQHAGH